jgi:hypothetical protein
VGLRTSDLLGRVKSRQEQWRDDGEVRSVLGPAGAFWLRTIKELGALLGHISEKWWEPI